MAQRVVIAMGTVNAPDVLVADEPTSGLDVTVQRQILDDMREACRSQNTSLLLITQDLSVVANYCDRVYVMYSGEVVESATTETLFRAPTHPCSAALLSIQRDAENASFRLAPVTQEGAPPAQACWLASRCPLRLSEAGCDSQHPELVVQANGSASRCLRASEVPQQLVHV
jgi:oligopeptide/dipeptide ABC transporter ATP-binding protein